VFSKVCCLRRLRDGAHPDLLARVTQRTNERYRKELNTSLDFVEHISQVSKEVIEDPWQLDDLVFIYRDDVVLSRSRHNT
jgi:Asp-tRNA(Asn)/Glu-tRNA(Gln) amidotransferase C subunit